MNSLKFVSSFFLEKSEFQKLALSNLIKKPGANRRPSCASSCKNEQILPEAFTMFEPFLHPCAKNYQTKPAKLLVTTLNNLNKISGLV